MFESICTVAGQTELLLNPFESYTICMAVKSVAKLGGSMAEVGVYKGGSAKLICKYKGDSPLHLFDTFEGLPEPTERDTSMGFHEGQFGNTSRELVEELLKPYSNVHIYQGFFPDTALPIERESFSFVNLDVDLHDSTLAALEFFYPRTQKGGIILSHDYSTADGVRKAVDEFFARKPEPILPVSDSQCLIVKG